MKRGLVLLICLAFLIGIVSLASATDYYVKNVGNDNADGLSDATAWATISKVNSFANAHGFHDGDSINFKRGSVWSNDETLGLNGDYSVDWGTINGLKIQDYGSGALPWLDGNTQEPIFINDRHLSNLIIKNIDCSGTDWPAGNYGNVAIINVNGVTADGLYIDGHKGSSEYHLHPGALGIHGDKTGNLEVKNCIIKNMFRDTFENTYNSDEYYNHEAEVQGGWGKGAMDNPGIFFYFNKGKTEGSISVHDNIITNIYSDSVAIEGSLVQTDIYNNIISGFGEEAIETKGSRHIDIYNNDISWNDFGSTGGESYYGAKVLSGTTSSITNNSAVGYYTFHDNYVHDSDLISISSHATLGLDVFNNYFKDVGLAFLADVHVKNQRFFNNLIVQTVDPGETCGWYPVENCAMQAWTYKSGAAVRESTSGIGIYNNSFYISSSNHNQGVYLYDGAGATVEGNIIYMTKPSGVYPLISAGTSPTVSNNDYYNPNSNNRVSWAGTSYSSSQQSAWQSTGHTGGLFTDPLFTNPSDVLGNDGIIWTHDDGFIPQLISPVCTGGEGGIHIGVYDCLPSPPESTCGPADTNLDNMVSIEELISYIDTWKTGTISIKDLMLAIGKWKNGC